MNSLDYILEVQELVAELYFTDDVIGISDTKIHFRIGRFLQEFEDYRIVDYEGEFHLYAKYQNIEFVAVFDAGDIEEYFDQINNQELITQIKELYSDQFEE